MAKDFQRQTHWILLAVTLSLMIPVEIYEFNTFYPLLAFRTLLLGLYLVLWYRSGRSWRPVIMAVISVVILVALLFSVLWAKGLL